MLGRDNVVDYSSSLGVVRSGSGFPSQHLFLASRASVCSFSPVLSLFGVRQRESDRNLRVAPAVPPRECRVVLHSVSSWNMRHFSWGRKVAPETDTVRRPCPRLMTKALLSAVPAAVSLNTALEESSKSISVLTSQNRSKKQERAMYFKQNTTP